MGGPKTERLNETNAIATIISLMKGICDCWQQASITLERDGYFCFVHHKNQRKVLITC